MKTVLQKLFPALIFSFIVSFSFAQAGTLDSSFGVNGIFSKDFSALGGASAQATAIQTDGKIIIVGYVGSKYASEVPAKFSIMRILSNGNLDSSFGTNGYTLGQLYNSRYCYALAVKIQSDGKLLVGGAAVMPNQNVSVFAIARYTSNGILDSSFGTYGRTFTSFSNLDDRILDIGILDNGKIIAVGSSNGYPAIACYKTNGVLDSSFGNNGIVDTHEGSAVYAIEILKGNRFIVISDIADHFSANGSDFCPTRYLSNGSIDSAFGTNGRTYINFGNIDIASCLALTQDSSLLIAGISRDNDLATTTVLTKLNKNGKIDSSFGVNGKIVSSLPNQSTNSLLIQKDQKILVVSPSYSYTIGRYNSNGSIDSLYGLNGMAPVSITSAPPDEFQTYNSAALQQDGRLIICGGYYTSFRVARLKTDDPIKVSLTKNISVTEGNTGTTTPATFTLTLNKAATKQVKVNYHTRNLSAKSGSDYAARTSTLTFGVGVTSKTVTVNVKGDDVVEKNERFAFVITDPTNAVLGTDSVICIIKNDDPSFAKATDEDAIKATAIKLYPNPVKDILTVEGLNTNSKTTISIVDAEGKIIAITTTTANSVQQNIKQLSPGTYFVKIESNNKTETFKFIKQ